MKTSSLLVLATVALCQPAFAFDFGSLQDLLKGMPPGQHSGAPMQAPASTPAPWPPSAVPKWAAA